MIDTVLPALESLASAPATDLQRVYFLPDTLARLRMLARNAPQQVNPAMVLAARYGSAALVQTVVPYQQVLQTGMTPVPMVRGLEYACAWWGGYRAAQRELGAAPQEGWWIHHQGVDPEGLVLSPTDVLQMQTEVVWQVGVETHRPRPPLLVLLSTVVDDEVILRGFTLDPEAVQGRELAVDVPA